MIRQRNQLFESFTKVESLISHARVLAYHDSLSSLEVLPSVQLRVGVTAGSKKFTGLECDLNTELKRMTAVLLVLQTAKKYSARFFPEYDYEWNSARQGGYQFHYFPRVNFNIACYFSVNKFYTEVQVRNHGFQHNYNVKVCSLPNHIPDIHNKWQIRLVFGG